LKLNSATLSNDTIAGAAIAAEPGDVTVRLTWTVRLALALLRSYKLLVSPLFIGSCRFVPSCSDYAADAVRQYGVAHGSWLAARRLARCHPFCDGGHDPVPPRG
jgi:putative membrane protein insertion efficiency factor